MSGCALLQIEILNKMLEEMQRVRQNPPDSFRAIINNICYRRDANLEAYHFTRMAKQLLNYPGINID